MKISTCTLFYTYLLGSRIQSCHNNMRSTVAKGVMLKKRTFNELCGRYLVISVVVDIYQIFRVPIFWSARTSQSTLVCHSQCFRAKIFYHCCFNSCALNSLQYSCFGCWGSLFHKKLVFIESLVSWISAVAEICELQKKFEIGTFVMNSKTVQKNIQGVFLTGPPLKILSASR